MAAVAAAPQPATRHDPTSSHRGGRRGKARDRAPRVPREHFLTSIRGRKENTWACSCPYLTNWSAPSTRTGAKPYISRSDCCQPREADFCARRLSVKIDSLIPIGAIRFNVGHLRDLDQHERHPDAACSKVWRRLGTAVDLLTGHTSNPNRTPRIDVPFEIVRKGLLQEGSRAIAFSGCAEEMEEVAGIPARPQP